MSWKEKYGSMSYEEANKIQYSYLDQIDFIPYLNKYTDLDDLWDAIEVKYDDTDFTKNDFLCGCIFNCMDMYDLKEYLEKRYQIKYYEEIITRYWRPCETIEHDYKGSNNNN